VNAAENMNAASAADVLQIGTADKDPGFRAHAGGLLKAASVCLLLCLIYWQSVIRLVSDWLNDSGASFGILIPPLALYVAWLLKARTLAKPVRESNIGIGAVAAGLMMFVAGQLGAEFFVTRVSLVVVLAGLVWTFQGWERLKTQTFPFILLLTAIPLPALVYTPVAIPLQLFASNVATRIIQSLGYTVYRDGNIIELPNISLGVAEACSGLSSLSSLIVAALLVGFLQCRRGITKVLLLVLAIPLAIGVNVLRIAGTALMAVHHEELALGFYHSFAGWLMFVVSFLLLIGISWVLQFSLERQQC
jgi:exosortase